MKHLFLHNKNEIFLGVKKQLGEKRGIKEGDKIVKKINKNFWSFKKKICVLWESLILSDQFKKVITTGENLILRLFEILTNSNNKFFSFLSQKK